MAGTTRFTVSYPAAAQFASLASGEKSVPTPQHTLAAEPGDEPAIAGRLRRGRTIDLIAREQSLQRRLLAGRERGELSAASVCCGVGNPSMAGRKSSRSSIIRSFKPE
jgi:hypothetical protein